MVDFDRSNKIELKVVELSFDDFEKSLKDLYGRDFDAPSLPEGATYLFGDLETCQYQVLNLETKELYSLAIEKMTGRISWKSMGVYPSMEV
jgi:hypothetical protein